MNKLLRFLLSFCMFYAVDPSESGNADQGNSDDGGENGSDTAPVDTGEAAWDAIQNGEGTEDDQAGQQSQQAEQQLVDKTEEQKQQEQVEAEAKANDAKTITDDDLKPLENAKPGTQERFQKITEGYKAEKARADGLEQQVNQFKGSFDSLRQLGFTDADAANDLVEFAGYRQVMQSGNVEQFQKIINAQLQQFEQLHGKRVTAAASLIDDYDDLKQAVGSLEITEAHAHEIARSRKLQERAQRQNQQQQEHQVSSQQHQQMVSSSANEVARMEANWRKTDPDFPAILPSLQEAAPEIMKEFPPSQWPKAFGMQYKAIKAALVNGGGNNNTHINHLRGGNGGSGVRREATSMQDAVLQEFDME